jgi:Zn-dependent protease with chaperone function
VTAMYSNLISFVAAILLYELYIPAQGGRTSHWGEILWQTLAVVVIFYGLVRWGFARWARRARSGYPAAQTLSLLHSSLLQRYTVTAVGFYALTLYLFRWKALCVALVGIEGPQSLSSLLGLAPFLLLLMASWGASYPSFQRLGEGAGEARRGRALASGLWGYIFSQAKFNLAIMLPWLGVLVAVDIVSFLWPGIAKHIQEDLLWGMAAFVLFLVALAWAFPVLLIKLWRCPPLPEGPRGERLRAFFHRHGFRYARIVLWDLFHGSWSTAGILGVFPRSRYVLITPALLVALDDEELEAVMAHEMGHARHLHMPFYLVFMLGLMLLFDLCLQGTTWLLTVGALAMEARGLPVEVWMGRPEAGSTLVSLLVTVPSVLLVVLYFRFGFGLFSRNFERQSDINALEIQGSSEPMIRALEKVSGPGLVARLLPNWHHFSIQERIDFMRLCQERPEMMRRHHRKVRVMVLCYLVGLLALAGGTVGWRKYQWGEGWTMAAVQSVIERRLREIPEDPRLWFDLGTLAFRRGDMRSAEEALRRAIELDPRNPEALNNLAWLYATAPEGDFFRPQDALRLALEARRLRPDSPHILDTLAEAYFVNGLCDEALETELQALAHAAGREGYYRSQVDRFRKALPRPP